MMEGSMSRRKTNPPGKVCALAAGAEAAMARAITNMRTKRPPLVVMAGLVPAIHALFTVNFKEDVDARHKAGHDEKGTDRGISRKHPIRPCPPQHLCL